MTTTQTGTLDTADPRADEDQQTFVDQCTSLMCRQEKTLWLLGENVHAATTTESLNLASRMFVQFVDFAETHFSKSESEGIASALSRVSEQSKSHEGELGKRSWRHARRLVALAVPSDEELQQSYEELGDAYENLFTSFFAICEKRLSPESPAMDLFSQSVQAFLRELKEKWQGSPKV